MIIVFTSYICAAKSDTSILSYFNSVRDKNLHYRATPENIVKINLDTRIFSKVLNFFLFELAFGVSNDSNNYYKIIIGCKICGFDLDKYFFTKFEYYCDTGKIICTTQLPFNIEIVQNNEFKEIDLNEHIIKINALNIENHLFNHEFPVKLKEAGKEKTYIFNFNNISKFVKKIQLLPNIDEKFSKEFQAYRYNFDAEKFEFYDVFDDYAKVLIQNTFIALKVAATYIINKIKNASNSFVEWNKDWRYVRYMKTNSLYYINQLCYKNNPDTIFSLFEYGFMMNCRFSDEELESLLEEHLVEYTTESIEHLFKKNSRIAITLGFYMGKAWKHNITNLFINNEMFCDDYSLRGLGEKSLKQIIEESDDPKATEDYYFGVEFDYIP